MIDLSEKILLLEPERGAVAQFIDPIGLPAPAPRSSGGWAGLGRARERLQLTVDWLHGQPFEVGQRVVTVELGAGVVVKDERTAEAPEIARRRVWVLLDAGHNPQPFEPGELRRYW